MPLGATEGCPPEANRSLLSLVTSKVHRLAGLVGTSRDSGGPAVNRLRSGILIRGLIWTLGEAGGVVYGVDRNTHGLLALILAAAQGGLAALHSSGSPRSVGV